MLMKVTMSPYSNAKGILDSYSKLAATIGFLHNNQLTKYF